MRLDAPAGHENRSPVARAAVIFVGGGTTKDPAQSTRNVGSFATLRMTVTLQEPFSGVHLLLQGGLTRVQ